MLKKDKDLEREVKRAEEDKKRMEDFEARILQLSSQQIYKNNAAKSWRSVAT